MTVNGHVATGGVVQKLAVGVNGRDDLAVAEADVFVIASGRPSSLDLLLAGDPFRDAPPIPMGPRTITYGDTKFVVKPEIGGPGQCYFGFPDVEAMQILQWSKHLNTLVGHAGGVKIDYF